MTTTLMIFQAVVSILLIVLVLLQFGKGAEAGLLSGGGGESIMTGAQQGNILSKATVILSILFMGNSVLLAKIQSEKAEKSLLDTEAPVARPLNSDAMDDAAQEADAKPVAPEGKNEKDSATTDQKKAE